MTLRYTPDGKTLLSSGCDTGSGEEWISLYLWDAHTGQRHQVIDVSLQPNWSVSPDAGLLADHGRHSTEGPVIEVRELATGKTAFTILDEKERFQMVQFAPDGKSLAAVCRISGEIRLYAVPGGQVSRCLPAPKDGSNFTPEMFTFSPDGQHLAVLGKGSLHAPICIYDAQGIRLPLHLVEKCCRTVRSLSRRTARPWPS